MVSQLGSESHAAATSFTLNVITFACSDPVEGTVDNMETDRADAKVGGNFPELH